MLHTLADAEFSSADRYTVLLLPGFPKPKSTSENKHGDKLT